MLNIYKPTKESVKEFHLKDFSFQLDSSNDLVIGKLIGPDGVSVFSEPIEFISSVSILYQDFLIIKIKNSYNIFCLDSLKLLFYEIIDNIEVLEDNIVELTLETGDRILYHLTSNMMINVEPNYQYLYLTEFNPKSLQDVNINYKNRTVEINTKVGVLVKKMKDYILGSLSPDVRFELDHRVFHQNSSNVPFNDKLKLVDCYRTNPNWETSHNINDIRKLKTVMHCDEFYNSHINLNAIISQTIYISSHNKYFMMLTRYIDEYRIILCYDNEIYSFEKFTQFYEITENKYLISGHGFSSETALIDTEDTGILSFDINSKQFVFNSLTRLNVNGFKQLNSDIDIKTLLLYAKSYINMIPTIRIPRFEEIFQYFLFHEFGRIFNFYNNNWYIIELDGEAPKDYTKIRQLTDFYYTYEGGLYKIDQILDNYLDESLAKIIKLKRINNSNGEFENSAILGHFIFKSDNVRRLVKKNELINNRLPDHIMRTMCGSLYHKTNSVDLVNNKYSDNPIILDIINILTDQGELEMGYLSETKNGNRIINTKSGEYIIDSEIISKLNGNLKYLSCDGCLFIYTDKIIYKIYDENMKSQYNSQYKNSHYMEFNSVLYHNNLNLFIIKSDKNDYFHVYNMDSCTLDSSTRSRTISGLFKNRYKIFGNSEVDFSVFISSGFQYPIFHINLQNFINWCEKEFNIQLNRQQIKILQECITPFLNQCQNMTVTPEIKTLIKDSYLEIRKNFRQIGSSLLLKLLALKLAEQGNRVKLITKHVVNYDKIIVDHDDVKSNTKIQEYMKNKTKIEHNSSNKNNNIVISFNDNVINDNQIGTVTIASKFIDGYVFNTDIILVDENIGESFNLSGIRGIECIRGSFTEDLISKIIVISESSI